MQRFTKRVGAPASALLALTMALVMGTSAALPGAAADGGADDSQSVEKAPKKRHKPTKDNFCVKGWKKEAPSEETAEGDKIDESDCDATYEPDAPPAPEEFRGDLKRWVDDFKTAQQSSAVQRLRAASGSTVGEVPTHRFDRAKEVVDSLSPNQLAQVYDALHGVQNWRKVPQEQQAVAKRASAVVAADTLVACDKYEGLVAGWLAAKLASTALETAAGLVPDDLVVVVAGFGGTTTSHPLEMIAQTTAQASNVIHESISYSVQISGGQCGTDHDLAMKTKVKDHDSDIKARLSTIDTAHGAIVGQLDTLESTADTIATTTSKTGDTVDDVEAQVVANGTALENAQAAIDDLRDLTVKKFDTAFANQERILADIEAGFTDTRKRLEELQQTADVTLAELRLVASDVDEVKKREIEESIAQCTRLVSIYLPEEFGGRLELARSILVLSIDSSEKAGLGTKHARDSLTRGDEERDAGAFLGAFKGYCKAYNQVLAGAR